MGHKMYLAMERAFLRTGSEAFAMISFEEHAQEAASAHGVMTSKRLPQPQSEKLCSTNLPNLRKRKPIMQNVHQAHFVLVRCKQQHWMLCDYYRAPSPPGRLSNSQGSNQRASRGHPRQFNKPQISPARSMRKTNQMRNRSMQ